MGCCDPIDGLADHFIAHAAMGVGASVSTAIRRDVLANRGTAASHARELFLEDRSAAVLGDILWLSAFTSGAAYDWVQMLEVP